MSATPHAQPLTSELAPEARLAAMQVASGLLSTYFSSGNAPLAEYQVVDRSKDYDQQETDDLLQAIRLRVALAAAVKLQSLLHQIVRRPTFRYVLEPDYSTGEVRGQLDLDRYSTQLMQGEFNVRFPIVVPQRAQLTPENSLAAYAAAWMLRELAKVSHRSILPSDSKENQILRRAQSSLQSLLRLSAFKHCAATAARLLRSGGEERLLSRVESKLRRREIANPGPYQELAAWIRSCLRGEATPDVGDVGWLFYQDGFDTKLFEIWCLHKVAEEISRQLVTTATPNSLAKRYREPIYTWERPGGRISLYYQRSPASIGQQWAQRWRRLEAGSVRPLGGIPDILVVAERRDKTARLAVLDPKLRQRASAPTEELYKVLGYFDNFQLTSDPYGAVLYYSPGSAQLTTYSVTTGGLLLAIGLDPAIPDLNRSGLTRLAGMCLDLLGIPLLGDIERPDANARVSREEAIAHQQIRARAREFLAFAETLPRPTLDSARRRLRMQLGSRSWASLSDDVRTMLASAECVGFSLEPDGDFSGPVLGLCASIEFMLFERLIDPVLSIRPEWAPYCKTLGQAIACLRETLGDNPAEVYAAFRRYVRRCGLQVESLRTLVPELEAMNAWYRIPAAHRSLVGPSFWEAAWRAIIGPEGALLSSLITALEHRQSGGPGTLHSSV